MFFQTVHVQSQVRVAATQALAQMFSFPSGVRSRFIPGWTLFVLGMLGVIIDAVSTFMMMSSGLFEEANGVAASGMAVVGMPLYVVGISLVAAWLVSMVLAKPTSVPAAGVWVCAAILAALKIWVSAHNIMLWVTVG